MSKRGIGKGKGSRNSRGSAGSVPPGQHGGGGGGQGPFSSGRARWSHQFGLGRAILPRHVDEVVEWMTNPSTSSSSSVSQAQRTSQSTTEDITAHSAALSIASPAIAPPKCTEHSIELFDHSMNALMVEDSQQLTGPETEEGGNLNAEKGGGADGQQIAIRVPTATSYCHVGNSAEEDIDDDEDSDRTWVPDRAEEEEEEEEEEESDVVETQPQEGRISSRASRQSRVRTRSSSQSISSDVSTVFSPPISHSSSVWAFFGTCAAERTVAVCNLCRMRIKRGKDPNHVGTTCLKRHLEKHHASRWQEHSKATPPKNVRQASAPPLPPSPAHRSSNASSTLTSLHHCPSVASTDRDEDFSTGVNLSVSSSTPPARVPARQMSLPQLLQRKKNTVPATDMPSV